MKFAISEDGATICASEMAPKEALCPACGHGVTLRGRKLMNKGGMSYFWRHKAGGPADCPARATFAIRPVAARK